MSVISLLFYFLTHSPIRLPTKIPIRQNRSLSALSAEAQQSCLLFSKYTVSLSVCLLPSPAGHDQISLNESQSSGNSLPALPRIAKLMKMGLEAKGILAQCLTSSNQLGSHCSWLLLVVLFLLSARHLSTWSIFPRIIMIIT